VNPYADSVVEFEETVTLRLLLTNALVLVFCRRRKQSP